MNRWVSRPLQAVSLVAGLWLFEVFIGPCVHLAVRLLSSVPDDAL